MAYKVEVIRKNGKKIIHSLAHHNPYRDDFEDHVFYIFNYALCIGCFAFLFGTATALIIGNVLYTYIVNLIDLATISTLFLACWIPSILQYSIQVLLIKPLRNRALKFLVRYLYPLGSIIFIFKNPLLGLCLAIPAGYLIIYIRKLKERKLK